MCTQLQAISILEEVFTACKRIYGDALQDAYLYGSYARGDFHAESDIDILLTVNMTMQEIEDLRRKLATQISDLSLEHDITISVTVKPLAQFRRYSNVLPYYQNVLKEGIRYAV